MGFLAPLIMCSDLGLVPRHMRGTVSLNSIQKSQADYLWTCTAMATLTPERCVYTSLSIT